MKGFVSVTLLCLLVGSCRQSPENQPTPSGTYNDGIFVVCEGAYGFGNASVYFRSHVSGSVFGDIYKSANGKALGDQLQSMAIAGDYGYLVVQNSQKVEVVSLSDFKNVATIISSEFLTSPRYLVAVSETKGYVSDWNADKVAIIDLATNTVKGGIAVGSDPDQMVLSGKKLFVANSGYAATGNNDNRISVIDLETEQVVSTITVGDRPLSMVVDTAGKIWVACQGFKKYDTSGNFSAESTAGGLYCIDPSTYTVEKSFPFANYDDNPGNLALQPGTGQLFYTNKGKVYTQSTAADTLENKLVIPRDFYGIAFDAEDGNKFLGCVSPNFTSKGKVVGFTIGSDLTAAPIDSFSVGVGPNSVVLR